MALEIYVSFNRAHINPRVIPTETRVMESLIAEVILKVLSGKIVIC